jgi:hypothetical protein
VAQGGVSDSSKPVSTSQAGLSAVGKQDRRLGTRGMDGQRDSTVGGIRGHLLHGIRRSFTTRNQMGFKNEVGTKERAEKISLGGQSEAFKSDSTDSDLQIRGNFRDPGVAEKRLVDVFIRSEGGILPCADSSTNQGLVGGQMERRLVQIQRPAFRFESFPIRVHQSGQTNGETLEKSGDSCSGIHRRLSGDGTKSAGDSKDKGDCGQGFGKAGMAQGRNQRLLGTNSRNRSVGFGHQFQIGKSDSATEQVGEVDKTVEKTPTQQRADSTKVGKGGRLYHQFGKGLFSSQAIHKAIVSGNEEIQTSKERLGRASLVDRTRIRRFGLAGTELEEIQRKRGLETIIDHQSKFRRINSGLGRRTERFESRGGLDGSGKGPSHQLVGADSGVQKLCHLPVPVEGTQHPGHNRQHNGASLHKQRGRSHWRVDRHHEGNLGVVHPMGGEHHSGSVDSKSGESSGRSGKQMAGLGRLADRGLGVSMVGQKVGTSHNRQICLRHQSSVAKIRCHQILSRGGACQHIHKQLGWRKQLGRASIQSGSQGVETFGRVSGGGYSNSSTMDKSTLVANVGEVVHGKSVSASSQKDLQSRSIRVGGTVERQQMEISGCQSQGISLDNIHQHASGLIEGSRVKSTTLSYQRHWKEWQGFCQQFGYDEWLVLGSEVEDFLAWLELSGAAGRVLAAVGAIRARFKDRGLPDPTDTHRVKQLVKGIQRRMTEDKDDKEERLPLPVSALLSWRKQKPDGLSDQTWIRDAAILVVGLRAMRRPGEFAKFKRKHLWKRDGWYYLKVPSSKTDQLKRGKVSL